MSAARPRRVVLAGGTGFLGEILTEHFLRSGASVLVLTRTHKAKPTRDGLRYCCWDGDTESGNWASELNDADVLINLAGRSVNCRYNARNRQMMMDSRIHSTGTLSRALARCLKPPALWLNASTATIYKHTYGPAWDEQGEIGPTPEAKDAFSVEIATAWEREFNTAPMRNTRKVALRTAMVFAHGGNSVFPMLRRLVRLGLGGRMGSGRQYVSWIHAADFCRALDWIIEHDDIAGPVNLAAPNPVSNAEMMATFRDLCDVPVGFPATLWMLELGAFFLRTETELIIKSRRVIPACLTDSGFRFHFNHLREALENLLKRGS